MAHARRLRRREISDLVKKPAANPVAKKNEVRPMTSPAMALCPLRKTLAVRYCRNRTNLIHAGRGREETLR